MIWHMGPVHTMRHLDPAAASRRRARRVALGERQPEKLRCRRPMHNTRPQRKPQSKKLPGCQRPCTSVHKCALVCTSVHNGAQIGAKMCQAAGRKHSHPSLVAWFADSVKNLSGGLRRVACRRARRSPERAADGLAPRMAWHNAAQRRKPPEASRGNFFPGATAGLFS